MNILVSAIIVSILNAISFSYNSPKCEKIIRYLEDSKNDSLFQGRNVLPKISCLFCSRPACNPEIAGCKSKSATPKIPLYHNILEFGLMIEYMAPENQIKIEINRNCILNMTVTNIAHPHNFAIKIFECPDNQCDKTFDYHELVVPESEKCVQIGMLFKGKKWIYFAFTGSCKYVPTIYFETSKTINIKNRKCEFNVGLDKPNVSFHFIINGSFPLDGVPIMLPCSPGGYVVDSSTGRFFHGNKCVENLNDPDFVIRYGGIDLVMEMVYELNENLLFPKKSFEKNGISPFPVYIDRNGRVASREEMKPKKVVNPISVNKTRFNCGFTVVKHHHLCDVKIQPLAHEQLWKNDANYSKYVPKYSCFICVPPECDYYNSKCKKWASTSFIPIYNQIFEFGLLGSNMPSSSDIEVALTELCHLKIDIVPLQLKNILSIYISECYILPHIGVQECLDHDYTLQARFTFPKDCLFLGMGFANNGQIFIGISLSCLSVPTAKFCYNGYITLRERACVYKFPKDELFVKYRFKQGLGRYTDGVPLILPCNPGGYVVDTVSGRFTTLKLCESLFSPPKVSDKFGIEFVIKKFYNNNENLLFPSSEMIENGRRIVRPLYIKDNLGAKSLQEMKHTYKPNIGRTNKVRNWCYLSKTKKKSEESKGEEECKALFYVLRKKKEPKGISGCSMNALDLMLILATLRFLLSFS